MTLSVLLRDLAVSGSVALMLEVLSWFHPTCRPFLKRWLGISVVMQSQLIALS